MGKNDSKADKEKMQAEKRRRRFWAFAQLIVGNWTRNKFNFSFDKS